MPGYINLTFSHNCLLLVAWWDNFGNGTIELQRLAIRVLSQCCSATGCERNWDTFKDLHSRKLSRLERSRLSDVVFVRYNLKLRERYKDSNHTIYVYHTELLLTVQCCRAGTCVSLRMPQILSAWTTSMFWMSGSVKNLAFSAETT